ncbi:hypothetical protein pb186bvf_015029 [Paramecium bursaria]
MEGIQFLLQNLTNSGLQLIYKEQVNNYERNWAQVNFTFDPTGYQPSMSYSNTTVSRSNDNPSPIGVFTQQSLPLSQKSCFRVKFNTLSWTIIGLGIKSTIAANGYVLSNFEQHGSGIFGLFDWKIIHSEDDTLDQKSLAFNYTDGDTIEVQYNPLNQTAVFKKYQSNLRYSMYISVEPSTLYYLILRNLIQLKYLNNQENSFCESFLFQLQQYFVIFLNYNLQLYIKIFLKSSLILQSKFKVSSILANQINSKMLFYFSIFFTNDYQSSTDVCFQKQFFNKSNFTLHQSQSRIFENLRNYLNLTQSLIIDFNQVDYLYKTQLKIQMDESSRIQSHYKLEDLEYDRFFETLTFEYKLLKVPLLILKVRLRNLTHQFQMNCFDNSQRNIKQSKNCARKCLDPYLSLRKQMQRMLRLILVKRAKII